MQSGSTSPLLPPASDILVAGLGAARRLTALSTRLAEKQLAFAAETIDLLLEETRRSGAEDARLPDWSRPFEISRRIGELTLRHLRETGEIVFEGERELLEGVAPKPEADALVAPVAEQPAVRPETPEAGTPAEKPAARATKRATAAADEAGEGA